MATRTGPDRSALLASLGTEIMQSQDLAAAFDDAAAAVLALDRDDLPCLTLLLHAGAIPLGGLRGALGVSRSALAAMLDRIELAGYARRSPGGDAGLIQLTDHARRWIETLWGPLREAGEGLMARYSTPDLALIAGFLHAANELQAGQLATLRGQLELPTHRAGRARRRGGLSPAALRRVEVYVETNLARPIHLADLAARAGLSPYHFARGFRVTVGKTPRAFIEHCRVERARALIGGGNQPLAQIAIDVGLGSQSRLTTVFRRATGVTPAAYRRGQH